MYRLGLPIFPIFLVRSDSLIAKSHGGLVSPLEGTVLCDVAVLPTVAKTGLLVTELRRGKRAIAEAVITSPSPNKTGASSDHKPLP